MKLRGASRILFICLAGTFIVIFLARQTLTPTKSNEKDGITKKGFIYVSDNKYYSYDSNVPLIFIGGMPRSGTTLLRAMLDAHPQVHCGKETRLIPIFLNWQSIWSFTTGRNEIRAKPDITKKVIEPAIATLILELMVRHGTPAPRLCNKDPFTILSADYLTTLFPHSKIIFMIRDGRAVVHSIISRNVTIWGFSESPSSYRNRLSSWNKTIRRMVLQCDKVGPNRCLRVHYEQLVSNPREQMKRILNFVDLPWAESVLHHERFINKSGGIFLSRSERSTDQVVNPINAKSLTAWVGHIPEDVVEDMSELAPMLRVLGYDL